MKSLKVRIAFFSNTVVPRNMKFGLNIHFSVYFIKTILDDERIRKNIALQYLKYQMCNIEFLQVRIAFFLNTVRQRNMKFGLNIHFSIYFIKMFKR